MDKQRPAYLTASGLPLSFEFDWPFHKSSSGADFYVLHGVTYLEDDSGLRADFSIHLSQTMSDMLPGTEQQIAEPYAINVVRKMVDTKDLEFLKSGKRQPIPLSSRFKNFKEGTWRFATPNNDENREFLRQSVYWTAHKLGRGKFLVADEVNALYLATTKENMLQHAAQLASEGWLRMEAEQAMPTEKLVAHADEFVALERQAFARLQEKHAFESAHNIK